MAYYYADRWNYVYDLTLGFGDQLDIYDGGQAYEVVVDSPSARLEINGSGWAGMVTVNAGWLTVRDGGDAANITVKKGAIINGVKFTAAATIDKISAKADRYNNTWQEVSKQSAVLTGEKLTGWVGFSDAKDFIKVKVKSKGRVSLDLSSTTAKAYQEGKLKLSLLNSSGKTIALAGVDKDTVASKSAVAKGTYYLGISIANEKKYNTDYSITTGLIASA